MGSLAAAADKAYQLLLCCQLFEDESSQLTSSVQLDRFKLWAKNIGVFSSWHASLDYRLRTVESVRDAVGGSIEVLCVDLLTGTCLLVIRRIARILTNTALAGGRDLTDEELDSLESCSAKEAHSVGRQLLTESGSDQTTLQARLRLLNSVENSITILHHLSLAIRRASNRNSLAKAHKLIDSDQGFTWLRQPSEDRHQILVDTFRYDISTTFRDYVTRVMTLRWLVAVPEGHENPVCSHMMDYRNTILDRCVNAVTSRRQQLAYFREHQDKIHGHRSVQTSRGKNTFVAHDFAQPTRTRGIKSMFEDEPSGPITERSNDRDPNMPPQSDTVPSNFQSSMFTLSSPSIGYSTSTAASETGALRTTGTFEVPPVPELQPGEREKMCPYCCLVLPAEIFQMGKRKRLWRRHLLDDLQPYVCLYRTCSSPQKTYRSFIDWTTHLDQPHGDDLLCPQDEEQDELQIQRDAPNSSCPSRVRPFQHRCFVCWNEFSSVMSLRKHVSGHLQTAFLLALPWRNDIDQDDERASKDAVSTAQPSLTDASMKVTDFGPEGVVDKA